jgi:hypothetical protein
MKSLTQKIESFQWRAIHFRAKLSSALPMNDQPILLPPQTAVNIRI